MFGACSDLALLVGSAGAGDDRTDKLVVVGNWDGPQVYTVWAHGNKGVAPTQALLPHMSRVGRIVAAGRAGMRPFKDDAVGVDECNRRVKVARIVLASQSAISFAEKGVERYGHHPAGTSPKADLVWIQAGFRHKSKHRL